MSKRVNNKRGKQKRSAAYGHPTKARGGSHGDHYGNNRPIWWPL